MPVQLPNHSHCVICQRAIEHGEKTCGPEHAAELDEINRKRKRQARTLYIMMAVAIGFLLLQLLAPQIFGG